MFGGWGSGRAGDGEHWGCTALVSRCGSCAYNRTFCCKRCTAVLVLLWVDVGRGPLLGDARRLSHTHYGNQGSVKQHGSTDLRLGSAGTLCTGTPVLTCVWCGTPG